MRILINVLSATGGGGMIYINNLLPGLAQVDDHNEYLVLTAPWQDFWDFKLPSNFRVVEAPLPPLRSVVRRLVWEQVGLPSYLHSQMVDVLFSVADITTLLASCKVVLAIRNPNPYTVGKWRYGWHYMTRNMSLKMLTCLSARRADRVTFVSQHSRDVVCAQLGIPKTKTHVVYHGISPIFSTPSRSVTNVNDSQLRGRPYILSVSNITEHKNYPFLVRAFARLCRQVDIEHDLVIAGESIAQDQVVEMTRIAATAGLSKRLWLLGQVPHADLPGLYQEAALFVFPSLLETFGLPLVEAMASSVPVVASNRTAIPEICQDAALYFNPTDVEDAAQKMAQALGDPALREQMVARGQARAAEFSWERTAHETLAVFEAAMTGVRQ